MPRQQVIKAKVDDANVISDIFTGGQWHSKAVAILLIEMHGFSLFTNINGTVADVVVMPGDPKYLRTDPDKTYQNNLLALPRF